MKALNEIGIKKAIKFGFYTIVMKFFDLLIFPQLRTPFLRIFGAKIGKDVIIHSVKFFNLYRTGFKGLTIGDYCFIGDETMLDLADKIIIGNNVTFAERVTVLTHLNVGYKFHPLQKHFPAFAKPVIIKDGVFVGACSTILSGVTINESSFITAGCVVTKDVPPNTLFGGVPGKVIRNI